MLLVPVLLLLDQWSHESVVFKAAPFDLRNTTAKILTVPRLGWALVAYVLIVFASLGVTGFLATFLVAVHGFSVEFAGAMFVVLYGVGALVRPVTGWLSDRISRLIVVSGATFLGSVSLVLLLLAPSAEVTVAAVASYAVGQRSYPAPFQAYLMDAFPDDSMAGDLGAIRTVYMGIGSLGPVHMGFVVESVNYTTAYASLVLCFLAAAAIAFHLSS